MKRFIYTIISALAIVFVIAIALISKNISTSPTLPEADVANNTSTNKELTKITVSEVTHSVFYAPQYIAINLGFFEEEGLEVELINGGGADNVMTAILADQVDIGFAGPEAAIYVYNEGADDYAKVFAQVTKKDGSMLVSKEPYENFKWTDLTGKHVLPGRTGGVPYMTFEYVLKANGIDPKNDLNLDTSISFDAMTSAFVAGTGDFVTVFEPTASNLELNGQGYIVAAVGAYTEEIPYTAYFTKKSYMEAHPDLIEKFTKAIYKGQQWVATHTPEEIADAVLESFPDSDKDSLISSIANYKEIDVWKADPIMTEESFSLLQEVMMSAGELENTAPFDKIIDNSIAEKIINTK